MTVLGYSEVRYYRHTGKAPVIGSTLAAVGAWIAVILLGTAYAYADLYVKVADIASILILMAFGGAMGFAVYAVLKWGRVRNMLIAGIIAVTAGVLAWYASWVMWEYALFAQSASAPPVSEMAADPHAIWRVAVAINREGTFTLNDRPVNGVELWLGWACEGLILIGFTAGIPLALMRDLAFCENCRIWTRRQKGIYRVNHGDEDVLREHMENKNFDHLAKLGLSDAATPVHLRVDLHACPRCDQTNLLSVNRITIGYSQGNRRESVKKVVDRLWIDPQQAADVRAVPQQILAAMAIPAAETSEAPTAEPSSEARN